MTKPRFPPEQVQIMCDLMDDGGLTAAEVGDRFGITGNAVLGLRHRAGRSRSAGHIPAMAAVDTARSPPCLRCGSTSARDPAHRLCGDCKNADVFGGMYGAHYR